MGYHHWSLLPSVPWEREASSWLTTIPIREHGFALHKGDFMTLCLKYGWTPPYLSSTVSVGMVLPLNMLLTVNVEDFSLSDIMSSGTSQLISSLRFVIMFWLSLHFFLSTGNRSAITEDNVRDDIAMSDFWSSCQRSFFDVCVFNPFTSSYIKSPLKACHRRNELEKRKH